jgi:hypothetical protein
MSSKSNNANEVSGSSPPPSNVHFDAQQSSPTNTASKSPDNDMSDYPEQKHAGVVGYGPNYTNRVGLGEKVEGIKEQIKGKLTKNPDLVEHGHLRQTGQLKEHEEEDTDPIASPEEKKP